jgi:hypothetical protein
MLFRSCAISLAFFVFAIAARADLITPIHSSLSLTAQAQVGFSGTVTDTSSESQNATINTLSASVSADTTYRGDGSSLLVVGSGSATWASAASGEVTFTDMGWTGVRAGGHAYLYNSTGWTY